ncbi:MAG: phosphatase PAP2 family protein [Rhodoferax sp.]|nr:phosphatase PAP2 family protein [Rhodoferax sp.]
MRLANRTPFPLWLWLLPFALFAASAPLWLHVWEPGLFLYLNRLCLPVVASVWTALSLLGTGWGVLGITAPLLLLAPRLLWAWVCAAPFAMLFARLGKSLLDSTRPAAEVDMAHLRIVGEVLHNNAMPSGHTTTAFAVATAMLLALPPVQRKKHGWLLLLACGTGLSRIAVGAHWPGDVAVGASLGLLAGLLGHVLLQSVPQRWHQPTHWAMRGLAVLVLVAVFFLLSEALDFEENLAVQRVLAALAVASLLAFVLRNARSFRPT